MGQETDQKLAIQRLLQKDSIKNRINEIMGRRGPQFSAALVQLTKQNEMLKKCNPETVVGAALTAAALDLPIDPNLGQAHVVPYGNEAQFQIGYKGLIQLAQRSGQMVRMSDVVIPQGALNSWNPLTEELDVDFTSDQIDWDAKPEGYAFYFKTISGFEKTVFWSYERAYNHGKRYSKSFNKSTSPWKTNFDDMSLKSVIKNTLVRYGPLSVEVQSQIAKDQGVIDIDDSVHYPDNPEKSAHEEKQAADILPSHDDGAEFAKKAEPEQTQADAAGKEVGDE